MMNTDENGDEISEQDTSNLFPRGTFNGFVTNMKAIDTENIDRARVGIELKTEIAGENGEKIPRSITWYGSLWGKGDQFCEKVLMTCGWPGEGAPMLAQLTNEISFVVEWEQYEGTIRAVVRYINAVGGGQLDSIAANEEKSAEIWAAFLNRRGRPQELSGQPAARPAPVQQRAAQTAAKPAAQRPTAAAAPAKPRPVAAAAPRPANGGAKPQARDQFNEAPVGDEDIPF